MKKENLEKIYTDIKNNLSIILLIPTILGGMWQLLELSRISTSFIRFFSLGQLVADGILILFILANFYLSYKLLSKSVKENISAAFSTEPISLSQSIFLLTISIFFLFFWGIPFYQSISVNKTIHILEIVLIIPISVITFQGIFIGIYRICQHIYLFASKCKFLQNKKIKKTAHTILGLVIVIIGLWLLKFIIGDLFPYWSNLRRIIVFPDKLLNKELLDKKIMKDYRLKSKPILIYNNDKYLFYSIYDERKKEKILIVDFSKLIY